ncbi:hypothetical protein, partial [Hyphomonas sp.]
PLSSDFQDLAKFVPTFIELCGVKAFKTRVRQLRQDIEASPYLAKIVIDYHWMELCLSDLGDSFEVSENGCLDDWCAVKFAAMCVEVYLRLTQQGKKELSGRFRDALKSDAGFAPLYAEMDIALRFLALDFDVGFEDLDGRASFDFLVSKGGEECEIECKAFSVDAGRKVHRRDFYRLVHHITPDLLENPPEHHEALIVTMRGRLIGNDCTRQEIAAAIRAQINSIDASPDEWEHFDVVTTKLSGIVVDQDLHAELKNRFGHDMHAAGAITEEAGRLIIVRSDTEDDPSKPVLQHLRSAAEQLSKTRAGFIALQFNDIELSDKPPENLLRRTAIISNALFYHYNANHVAGVMIGTYRNAVGEGHDISAPVGTMVLNSGKVADLGPNIRSIIHLG